MMNFAEARQQLLDSFAKVYLVYFTGENDNFDVIMARLENNTDLETYANDCSEHLQYILDDETCMALWSRDKNREGDHFPWIKDYWENLHSRFK